MGLFKVLKSGIGFDTGERLAEAFKAIVANFGLLEPGVTATAAANYVLKLGDRIVSTTAATAQVVTIPVNDANTTIPIGYTIEVTQSGAGAASIAAASGAVTINRLAGKTLNLSGVNAAVRLRKMSANVWLLSGDLA